MIIFPTNFFRTIRFKLMAGLFAVLTVSIAVAMFGIWTYERDSFMTSIQGEAMRAGRIVEKSLRSSMLSNDRETIQKSIDKISEIMEPPSRLAIVSSTGLVVFASDPSMVGTTFSRTKDPSCSVCHAKEGMPPDRSVTLIPSASGPMIRNVIKIANHPVCHQCHDSGQKVLGILIFDSYVQDTFQMLKTVALRIFLTGLVTFAIVIVVLTWLVTRLIHRPIQTLTAGFMEVGRGNFNHWVDIEGTDEFSDMADTFNVMSRAIGRYIAEVKVRSAETSTLYTMLQKMSKTIKIAELTGVVFDLLYEFFEYEEIILIRFDENRQDRCEATWRMKLAPRLNHIRFDLGADSLPGSALEVEEFRRWATDGFRLPVYEGENEIRALIPLVYNGEKAGLICLRFPEGRSIAPQEKRLIGALANHVAISFANAKLYHMATTDGLTGLFTKRYFMETVAHMATPGLSCGKRFWLMMMDLDHFKEVNDTYGHPAGDQVLIQVAELIRANIRYGDVPCRYGGEEFIVVLPEAEDNENFVEGVAHRLLEGVAAHVFICADCPPIRRTISIGIAAYPDHATSLEGVIQAADNALYAAKRGGRNQVCCAPALTDEA